MAVVSSDFLAGVLTNFRAMFKTRFEAAKAAQGWRDLVVPYPSDGAQNTYEWMGTVPKMQDVTDKTVDLQGLPEFNFSVFNKEYQAAIEVSRMALERDQLGLIAPRVGQLALEAARFPGEQILALVRDNALAYDGAAFFADTRVIGASANIDNLLAGTAGVQTPSTIQASLQVATTAMRLFQDDKGRPMNLAPNTIMIPVQNEQATWQALNRTAGDAVNTPTKPADVAGIWQASGYRVIVNPFLTDINDFYLFYIGEGEERPFLMQEEKAPVLESDTDPMTRDNIIKRTFLYSVYGRWAVALTDPRYGVKIVCA